METYYCAICDISLGKDEIEETCCPFCGAEIPELAEDDERDEV